MKMDLLKDLKMLLLNFSYVMTYITRKMLVLLKIHLNYLTDNLLKCFFKQYNKLLFLQKKIFIIYNDKKSKA